MKNKYWAFALILLSAAAIQAQEKDSLAAKHYDLQEVTILGKPTEKVSVVPIQELKSTERYECARGLHCIRLPGGWEYRDLTRKN